MGRTRLLRSTQALRLLQSAHTRPQGGHASRKHPTRPGRPPTPTHPPGGHKAGGPGPPAPPHEGGSRPPPPPPLIRGKKQGSPTGPRLRPPPPLPPQRL